MKKRVLILTNLPTPYKIDFYNTLGKYIDLTVIFESRRTNKLTFNWNDKGENNFKAIYLNKENLNEKKIYWSAFRYLKNISYNHIIVSCYHTYTSIAILIYLKIRKIEYYFETDGGIVNKNETLIKHCFKHFLISGAKLYYSPSKGSDEYLSYYGANINFIQRYPFTSLKESDILGEIPNREQKLFYRKKLKIKEELIILAVGQFIHRKGYDILLQACKNIDKTIGIYIIGGNSTKEYQSLKEDLSLTNVHFGGFKTKEELKEYYLSADLFVHPTREDIWGLVINEAMGFGLPVITTTNCVAGNELIDKDYIIPIEDKEALYSSMMDILMNDKKRQYIGKRNLLKIKNYTIEKMSSAHLNSLN